jgi:hypothetical protein
MLVVASCLNVADQKSVTKSAAGFAKNEDRMVSRQGYSTHETKFLSPSSKPIAPLLSSRFVRRSDPSRLPVAERLSRRSCLYLQENAQIGLGRMKGTAEIVDDIVSPVIDLEDIEALQD